MNLWAPLSVYFLERVYDAYFDPMHGYIILKLRDSCLSMHHRFEFVSRVDLHDLQRVNFLLSRWKIFFHALYFLALVKFVKLHVIEKNQRSCRFELLLWLLFQIRLSALNSRLLESCVLIDQQYLHCFWHLLYIN